MNDLANGKRVLTKFRQAEETIRKRDFKKLQALKVRSHAESLDNSNKFDAEFFRQLKENQKKTYIYAFKENKSTCNADSVTTPYEKLKVAESFYKSLYSSVTNEIDFQEKFLNSLTQKISDERNASLCEPLSKSDIKYALNTFM